MYLLEKIYMNEKNYIKKTADVYHISTTTIYRYLSELENEHILLKTGKRQYRLTCTVKTYTLSDGEIKDEDLIYDAYIAPLLNNLPDNVRRIWSYAFTEMVNNVIDHSNASQLDIVISVNYLETQIMLQDNGVGIFAKIKDYYHYNSLDDAVHELFKGKLTTDSANHSGEGIFFTSRALDKFAAISDGKIFSHNKYLEKIEDLDNTILLKSWTEKQGTTVFMGLSNFSKRKLKEVFDTFANVDGGFIRTRIPLKNIFENDPISRSQAKRLCNRFENFEEVELDFEDINEIGQGFAHELFVVFQNNHPDVKLIPVHTCNEVEKMINHVTLSGGK